MAADRKPAEQTVACEVCMKEIPLSAAKTSEAIDYVVHFCGLDCYEAWHEKKAKRGKQDATEKD